MSDESGIARLNTRGRMVTTHASSFKKKQAVSCGKVRRYIYALLCASKDRHWRAWSSRKRRLERLSRSSLQGSLPH